MSEVQCFLSFFFFFCSRLKKHCTLALLHFPSRGKNGTESSALFEKLCFAPKALKLRPLSLLACSFSHRFFCCNDIDLNPVLPHARNPRDK